VERRLAPLHGRAMFGVLGSAETRLRLRSPEEVSAGLDRLAPWTW